MCIYGKIAIALLAIPFVYFGGLWLIWEIIDRIIDKPDNKKQKQ